MMLLTSAKAVNLFKGYPLDSTDHYILRLPDDSPSLPTMHRVGGTNSGYEPANAWPYMDNWPSQMQLPVPRASSGVLELFACGLSRDETQYIVVGGAKWIALTYFQVVPYVHT